MSSENSLFIHLRDLKYIYIYYYLINIVKYYNSEFGFLLQNYIVPL